MTEISNRVRHNLKRWAKGKLIKVREEQELGRLGYIDSRLEYVGECHCVTVVYLTKAGRAALGPNVQVNVNEEM